MQPVKELFVLTLARTLAENMTVSEEAAAQIGSSVCMQTLCEICRLAADPTLSEHELTEQLRAQLAGVLPTLRAAGFLQQNRK